MRPASLLERHGLPTAGLQAVSGGTTAEVWRTDEHVLRIGSTIDHGREARIAEAAVASGVRTARSLAHGRGYGIWERLPGAPASQAPAVPVATWSELLKDLERLHAAPPEPRPIDLRTAWRGTPALIDRTQERARWTGREAKLLQQALGTERPVRHAAFVHGDAWARNVLVDDRGGYVGILDWGCARWAALEEEASRLEDPALDLAIERWGGRLDLALLYGLRLGLLLNVALQGRASFDDARRALSVFARLAWRRAHPKTNRPPAASVPSTGLRVGRHRSRSVRDRRRTMRVQEPANEALGPQARVAPCGCRTVRVPHPAGTRHLGDP